MPAQVGQRETEQCDCFRLTEVLRSGERMPEHVCELTMRRSCLNWLQDELLVTPNLVGFKARFPVRFPIGNGLRAHCQSFQQWPYPVIGIMARSAVFLIVRQWVEQPPETELAALIQNKRPWDSAWKIAANDLRHRYEEISQGTRTEDLFPLLRYDAKPAYDLERDMITQAQDCLALVGLPPTPGTAEYLLSKLPGCPFGKTPIGPTRGVVVTSYGLSGHWLEHVYQNEHRNHISFDGDMCCQIGGSATWAVDSLMTSAIRQGRRHKKMWAKHAEDNGGKARKGDKRALNKRQPPIEKGWNE